MQYDKPDDAISCEDRVLGKEYPIGCIYGDHVGFSMYTNITFAVAINIIEGHTNRGASWACRDNGAFDSLGKYMCSGNSLYLNENDCRVNPKTEHFKRMVKFLWSIMVDITVWDGEKAVSYATFMKLHRKEEWPK
jgi:hypothetical protein